MKKKNLKNRLKMAITFITEIAKGGAGVSDHYRDDAKILLETLTRRKKTDRIKTEGNPEASKKAWKELTGADVK